jgi:hypothetical protein
MKPLLLEPIEFTKTETLKSHVNNLLHKLNWTERAKQFTVLRLFHRFPCSPLRSVFTLQFKYIRRKKRNFILKKAPVSVATFIDNSRSVVAE